MLYDASFFKINIHASHADGEKKGISHFGPKMRKGGPLVIIVNEINAIVICLIQIYYWFMFAISCPDKKCPMISWPTTLQVLVIFYVVFFVIVKNMIFNNRAIKIFIKPVID